MSIADKITQLTNIRAAIRAALQNKGIAAASSHNFSDFAADISGIPSGSVTPGSLIVVMCSTGIDSVFAAINNVTYPGYLDTSTHTAYITIPYTMTSGTVTVRGYAGSTVVATDTVTISGIDKYYSAVLETGTIYDAGTWYTRTQSWLARNNGISLRASDGSAYIIMTATAGTGEGFVASRYPIFLPASCTAIKVTISMKTTPTLYFGIFDGNTLAHADISAMLALAVGENTFTVPSSALGKEMYLWFGTDSNTTTTTNRITKIEFV